MKLAKKWVPICKYMAKKLVSKFDWNRSKHTRVWRTLVEGPIWFCLYEPLSLCRFPREIKLSSLSQSKDKRIKGIFVVSKDSILKIKNLHKKKLAFLPLGCRCILTRSAPRKTSGFFPPYVSFTTQYKCCVRIFQGVGVKRTFNNLDPQIRNKLKILWETKPYTLSDRLNRASPKKYKAAKTLMKPTPTSLA